MNNFEHLLDEGEEIIKEIKPLKKPTNLGSWICVAVLAFFAIVFTVIPFLVNDFNEFAPMLGIAGMCLIPAVIGAILTPIAYKKYLYCITNKKVIIRSGIIGIDYRVIELDSITTVDVITGLSDKLCGYKTSTIAFYNASNSCNAPNGQGVSYKKNAFLHIENSNEIYKQVKALIKNAKDSK